MRSLRLFRIRVYGAAVDVHAAGVQHNDLECRNFVRDQDGRVYAIDFGLSTVGHRCVQETCPELGSLRQDLALGVPLGALFTGRILMKVFAVLNFKPLIQALNLISGARNYYYSS